MPRSILEIRKANGGLGNLSDEDIVQNTYSDFSSYYKSQDEYAKAIGYADNSDSGLTFTYTARTSFASADAYRSASITARCTPPIGTITIWLCGVVSTSRSVRESCEATLS